MDHREIAESINSQRSCHTIKCHECQFVGIDYYANKCVNLSKQWLKDNYIHCLHCQQKIKIPTRFLGKIICPRCKQETWITVKPKELSGFIFKIKDKPKKLNHYEVIAEELKSTAKNLNNSKHKNFINDLSDKISKIKPIKFEIKLKTIKLEQTMTNEQKIK